MLPADWLETIDRRSFRRRLLAWYDRNARDFPWRRTTDPYPIWVSEVMLQQTTTATVANRYQSFLDLFPTLAELAAASEETVLRAWEGLGYYRRARNLQRAARLLVAEQSGTLPNDPDVLRQLPGMGKYSANAVVSFAHNRPLPILEANTIRLWSRLCALRGDPKKQPNQGRLWSLAEQILPPSRPRDFNFALMDLGATVCTPRAPDCKRCPLTGFCRAFQSGRPEHFPAKAALPATVEERHVAVILRSNNRILIVRRGDHGRWAGLWEFPNAKVNDSDDPNGVAKALTANFADSIGSPNPLTSLRHGVMHYRIHLTAYLIDCRRRRHDADSCRWVTATELEPMPLSSAHRRIAAQLRNLPVSETAPRRRRVRED